MASSLYTLQTYDDKFSFALCSFVVNETLDSILDESGDEEEQEAVVNQVLDEIGIEISGKVKRGSQRKETGSKNYFVKGAQLFLGHVTCIYSSILFLYFSDGRGTLCTWG